MSRLLDFTGGYRGYLESDRWREVRAEAIARAGGRCVLCNGTMGLQGHHREYSTMGTPEEVENVFPLCQRCHEAVTALLAGDVRNRALSEKKAAR